MSIFASSSEAVKMDNLFFMKNHLLPKTHSQWKAHKSAMRKRETWMPRLQESMFRKHNVGRMFQ